MREQRRWKKRVVAAAEGDRVCDVVAAESSERRGVKAGTGN